MNRGLSLIAAAAAGAAASYLLDAQEGRRRRALLRGKVYTLRGPVLKRELKRALQGIASVRGTRREDLPDIARDNWSPATRFLVGAGGAAAIAYGLVRRSPTAALLGAGGVALLARAGTNMDMKRLLGRRGRRRVEFRNTIHIEAPAEAVYRFWSDFENFPKFMHNVLSVYRNRDDTWHWEVAGPMATTVRWDARITRADPPHLIAWATVPGWNVQHSGIVRFLQEGNGTRIEVRMAYNPVAGALGHFAAWLAGRDPRREMDEDLVRLKSFFESGKPARDAAQPARTPV